MKLLKDSWEIAGLIVLDSPGDISINYGTALTLVALGQAQAANFYKVVRSCIAIVPRLRET